VIYVSIPVKYRKLLDKSRFEQAASETLHALGHENPLSVVVKLTGDREMKKLNNAYRGDDKATDVLSFENQYTDPENGENYLGDIMISVETAAIQAEANGNSLQHEIEMLLVHGVLHLAGNDHGTKTDRDQMSKLQDQVLANIGNPLRESIQ
jgi:probable rRNA maturation factor